MQCKTNQQKDLAQLQDVCLKSKDVELYCFGFFEKIEKMDIQLYLLYRHQENLKVILLGLFL